MSLYLLLMCIVLCRFYPAACVKGHERLKPVTGPFGHFSPQQENWSFSFFYYFPIMAIYEQSIKSFTSRKQINLQCIIIISLRGRVSTKMMSKWFHESFQLKSHVHTHPVANSRGNVKNRSVGGSASATHRPTSHPRWPSFCWDGFFQGATVIA